jgi:hypothetical protein
VVEVDVEAIAIVVDDDDEEEMARLQRETEEMEEKQRKFERLAELRRRSMSARNSPALPSPIRQVNPVYVQTAAATTTINVQTVQNVNAPAKRSAETPTPPEPELKRQRVSGGTALAASSSRAMHTPKADELRRVETSGPSRASNSPTAPTAPTLAVAQRPVQAQDRPSVSDDARIRAEAERREREARTKKLEDERAAAYQKRMLAEEMEMPFTAGVRMARCI